MTEERPDYSRSESAPAAARCHGDRHGHLVDAVLRNDWRGSVGPYVEFLGQGPDAQAMIRLAAVRLVEALGDDAAALAAVADAALAAERRARGGA